MHQKWKFNTLRFDSYLIAASSILCSALLKKKSIVLLEVAANLPFIIFCDSSNPNSTHWDSFQGKFL